MVFTSSQAAVYAADYPADHVFTDEDLNLMAAAPGAAPYHVCVRGAGGRPSPLLPVPALGGPRNHAACALPCRAKSLAEWEAWAIAGQQKRWQLVVMCPAVVLGPPIVPNYRAGKIQRVRPWLPAPATHRLPPRLPPTACHHPHHLLTPQAAPWPPSRTC